MPLQRRLVVLTLALLGSAAPAHARAQGSPARAAAAATDSVKAELIRRLLDRMGAADQAIMVMEAAIPAQRAADPRVPAVFWERFLAAAKERRAELTDMIAVVYDRHFSADDIRQLLAFYETPVGRKMLEKQGVVAQESMMAGQQWGQRIGMAIGSELAAEGLLTPP